jgi:hypothetical protein
MGVDIALKGEFVIEVFFELLIAGLDDGPRLLSGVGDLWLDLH